jgi:hypothetical protein
LWGIYGSIVKDKLSNYSALSIEMFAFV